jgi:TIR domain
VAAIAQEVANVLTEKGYKAFVQDYDIPITANFIEEMHEAIKNSRDLVVLFTRDYEQSPYTRMEFTSFEANAAQSTEHRRMVILECALDSGQFQAAVLTGCWVAILVLRGAQIA